MAQAPSFSKRRALNPFLLVLPFICGLTYSASGAIRFEHAFSPQEGLTPAVEQPWRQEICLNGSWDFQPVALAENYDLKNGAPVLPNPTDDGWSATKIRIPSAWNVNRRGWGGRSKQFPSYPDEWDDVRMGWLKRDFTIPADWNGKRILLHFEAIAGYAQVVVNGRQVKEHFQNSLPFDVDITDFVNPHGPNTLMVGVRQSNLFYVQGKYGAQTYAAGPPWMVGMVGIWQDVFLQAVPPLRVEDVAIRPWVDKGLLELEITVRNNTPAMQTFRIGGAIRPWINEPGKDVISAAEPRWSLGQTVLSVEAAEATVGPKRTTTLTLRQKVGRELNLWTMDTPNLYGLILDITRDHEVRDRCYERFGWRQWKINGRGILLNGQRVQLFGECVGIGSVMHLSRRFAWARYYTLKSVGANAARLHVVVRPRFYLDLADEMGIAILDESDIWASSMNYNYGPPETWLRIGEHIDGMVLRDRNRPCVFGWSVSNEIQSALWFKGVPREYWPPVIDHVVALADRCRALDPTREWISSDGDGDFHGRLPVFSYHYGEPRDWLRNAPKDKPYNFGEAGSMLWGSPAVFSAYNGERSYESSEGMMEGVAIETYYYLKEQRKFAAYCSIFTFEGTAFESLPLGVADPSRQPTPDDGIVFGPFVEGQPGIQPEKIYPYSSRLNPGFDPNLPLFKKTVVYDAFKAGFAPGGPAPCEWDHFRNTDSRPAPPAATIEQVAFIGDPQGRLKMALESAGVPAEARSNASTKLLVIEGGTLTKARLPEAQEGMQAVLHAQGTVFLWASPENMDLLNQLLPSYVEMVKHESSQLFADRGAPETASISLASLYFRDQSDPVIVKNGLAGPLVEKSRILIESNDFGRRRYSAATSEKLPTMIACETGGGRLLVTSLMPDVRSERRLQLMRNLFASLEVRLSAPSGLHDTGLDGANFLDQALIIGSFQGERYPGILDDDFIGSEAHVNPKPGDTVGERTWQIKRTSGDGIFDFFRIELPGTEGNRARVLGDRLQGESLDANGYIEDVSNLTLDKPGIHSVAYLSFWLYTPQAVQTDTDPKVVLVVTSDDGTKIWLNQKQVLDDHLICGPGFSNTHRLPLSLTAGWNHVVAKVGQLDGPWTFRAQIECSNPDLLGRIRARATAP